MKRNTLQEGIAPSDFAAATGYDSPHDMGRAYYKYTDCGPWTTFHCLAVCHSPTYSDPYAEVAAYPEIYYDSEDGRKTWEQLESEGITEILGVTVGSIVEGVDQDADPVYVDLRGKKASEAEALIDAAVENVNNQCESIWNDTHGCPTCAKHFGVELDDDGFPVDLCPVWTECTNCGGHGEAI